MSSADVLICADMSSADVLICADIKQCCWEQQWWKQW